MRETADGGRSWSRTGTPSAGPFSRRSRDQNGRPCITISRSCTKRSNVRNLEKTRRPKALWSLKQAKDKGIDFYDLGSVQKIQTRPLSKVGSPATHLKSPTAALPDVLRRKMEQDGHRPPPQVEATREWRLGFAWSVSFFEFDFLFDVRTSFFRMSEL